MISTVCLLTQFLVLKTEGLNCLQNKVGSQQHNLGIVLIWFVLFFPKIINIELFIMNHPQNTISFHVIIQMTQKKAYFVRKHAILLQSWSGKEEIKWYDIKGIEQIDEEFWNYTESVKKALWWSVCLTGYIKVAKVRFLEITSNFACLPFGAQLPTLKLGSGKTLIFSKLYAKQYSLSIYIYFFFAYVMPKVVLICVVDQHFTVGQNVPAQLMYFGCRMNACYNWIFRSLHPFLQMA